jgi:hypothetical protein
MDTATYSPNMCEAPNPIDASSPVVALQWPVRNLEWPANAGTQGTWGRFPCTHFCQGEVRF